MAELRSTTLFGDANLVAYYKLNTGALTTDSKGSYTLTNNNSVGEIDGKYSTGADFGTANTNKSLSTISDLGIAGGAITISGWFKVRTDIADGADWHLVAQEDSSTSVMNSLSYNRSGSTRRVSYRRYRQGIAADEVNYNVDLGISMFHHIVLTYDTTNLRGYLNGALVAGPTAFSGNGTGVTADAFAIGNQRGLATGHGYYSSIIADEVSIFNRALSLSEILILYNGGSKNTIKLQAVNRASTY